MDTSTPSSSYPPPTTSTPTNPMAPPTGQLGGASKMQQEPAVAPDVLPTEAAAFKPSSRAIAIPPQTRGSIYQRREKDIAPVQPAPRTDSIDSYRTSFRNGRTDTTWSVFTTASTITDATEPPSPEAEQFNDEPMIFEDSPYASSPRPFGQHSRTVTFQGGPSRTASFALGDQDNCRPPHRSCSPDNTPLPRHPGILRLHDRSQSPRRGILRSSTGFNPTSGRQNSAARRGSNQWPTPLPYRPRPSRWTIDKSEDSSTQPQASPEPTTYTEPDTKAPEETSESSMLRPIETVTEDPEPPSTPVEKTAAEEAIQEDEGHTSDSSDSVGYIGTPSSASSSRPDDKLVQDTCDHLLKNVFGVDLQELGATDAGSAAYDSVNYCLDELSHLVPQANSITQLSPPLREAAPYVHSPGGYNAPIQPDNGMDYSSYQIGGSGNGNGNGDGGDRKRPNDGAEDQGRNNGKGKGNGDRNKRPKVTQEPAEDQKLSCPFRKRNPVKFNVRDHQSCAVQSFPDISQLKRHVKNFHRQRTVSPFACPRCKQDMLNKEGLENHLRVPNDEICTPQETPLAQNPEDGITPRIEDVLNGRKANTKVDTWDVLWPTLFPEDTFIPDPHFVPPVELDEVLQQFKNSSDDLEARIREKGFDEERIAWIKAICTGHIESVFASSRIPADNAPGRPRRNRSHGHGQNPRLTANARASTASASEKLSGATAKPVRRRRSSQQLTPSEATPPHSIPKGNAGQGLSVGESSPSSSLNSIEGWANIEKLGHMQQPVGGPEASTSMPTQPLNNAYANGLTINTRDAMPEIEDIPLSALTTGPAGSPAHLISPVAGQAGSVIPPPPAHIRNGAENGFQIPTSGGPTPTSSTAGLLGHQLHHHRADSGVAGISSAAPFFNGMTAYQNQQPGNLRMYNAVMPNAFSGMQVPMGGVYPTQQMHTQMQFRPLPGHQGPASMPGGGGDGTINPRILGNYGNVGSSMGLGNSGNSMGNGYSAFSPGNGGSPN